MQPGTEHLTNEQRAQFMQAEEIFADDAIERSPQDVQELLAAGAVQVIDVRESYERELGYIPGSRHVEIERLAWNSPTVDRAQPVVFCCRLGLRAKLAAHAFRRVGFEAYNVTGGFAAWHAAGLPVAPDNGRVADH